MKKIAVIVMLVVFSGRGIAQSDKPVESKITDVTVFLNKAQVTREVKTRIESGKTNLILTGLTSQLDQQSIQVAGKGNFIILGITHQQNYLNELNMPKVLRSLKDSVEYFQKQIALEQSQKEILSKEEHMLLSNQKIGGANQNLTAAELKAMADFFRGRLNDIITSGMKHDERIKKINERMAKLQRQLNEQNELYARNTSEIVVTVSAEAATSVDLEVNYVVANAGWHPLYDLRAKNTKSPVQLSYKANVYQSTGEVWKNVKLKLSTANPDQGGFKPELYTWYLDIQSPVVVRTARYRHGAMEEKSAAASAPAAMGAADKAYEPNAESVADFTTTIQTSLNTEFNIGLPYTVSSSNKPTLVDIRNHELKADYLYSVAPKLDLDAFLMARITGWEEFNLLPGEANVFFEGTYVSKTYINPNEIKDTLSISLGRDKRIVVKREKLQDFTSRKAVGTNQRDSYAYEVSVRNTKSEAVKIIVEDQIPVSQNSQVEVSVIDVGNANYNKDTGKLIWQINLQPSETKKAVYKFEVKYPKDKKVTGL